MPVRLASAIGSALLLRLDGYMRFKPIRQLLEVIQKLLGHVTGELQMNVKVLIKLFGIRR